MRKRSRPAKRERPQTATDKPPASTIARLSWLVPLPLFLVLRLFSPDPYYLLGGDQCTFLELGRTFPKHQLFNHELYLIHPPLFDYVIGVLHLVLPLLAAGLVATLLFSCVNLLAMRALGEFEGLPGAAIFAGLTYLALSRPAIAYDYHVARVSPLVATTALALLAFLRLLRDPSRKTLLIAIAANAACLLVSDQAILLLPCEAAIIWARGSFRQWRWVPLGFASAGAALLWPAVRLVRFLSRADLPAGIDGAIEFTRNFPWRAVIQPNYLPFTNAHRSLFTQTSLSLLNLKPALLAGLPVDLVLIPRTVSMIVVLGLTAAALARRDRRRSAALWLGLSIFFLLPVGVGMNEWYGMGFIVPFVLLMMEGAAAVLAWAGSLLRNPDAHVTVALSAVCALLAAIWMAAPVPGPHGLLDPRGGTNFLFARTPLTRASGICRYFDSMPRDIGIMAPQGLSPEVVYLTDKRVVALPFDPRLLDRFIAEYRISYIVTSSEYLPQYRDSVLNLYTSHLVSPYIVDHLERYRLVRSLHEGYPEFYPEFASYVFQVRNAP